MLKRIAPSIFFILCALEGVWVLSVLGDPPALLNLGTISALSPFRLGLILYVALMVILFVAMAVWEWLTKQGISPVKRLLSHHILLLIVTIVFSIGLFVLYITVFSPIAEERLHAYFMRWRPLFVWILLIFIQFFCLTLILRGFAYWKNAWIYLKYNPRVMSLSKNKNSVAAGAALLGLSILIGLTKVYFGRFVDEADNITGGWLLSQGYTLYRDVFTHHFPFPYYWIALVTGIFGNSFVAVRISLLLLQVGLFAVGMRITGLYLAIGLTSLAWNLINHLHRGQEAIYATVEGIFMVVVLILILWLLTKRSTVGKLPLVIIGLLLGAALLTDPLMIYAAVIAIAGLFVSGLRTRSPSRYHEGLRRVLWSGLAAALLIGVFAVVLLLSGTVEDFYRDAILFNADIYAKYVDAGPLRLDRIVQNIATGLNILDERWYRYTTPFLPLHPAGSVSLDAETVYLSWMFSSFLYRLSIIACILGLFLNRKLAAGIFLLLFAATMLPRTDEGIYAIGFVLVSLYAAFYLLVELRLPVLVRAAAAHGAQLQKTAWSVVRYAWIVLLVVIGVMQLWSAFRGGYFITTNWFEITNDNHVTMYRSFGDDIRQAACGQEDVELAVFPVNPIVYFVSEISPASRYTYMYPWVAETGQDELIQTLSEHHSAVVWIQQGRKRDSPDGVANYMADTIEFLNKNYVRYRGNYWMSPELAEICSVEPVEIPVDPDDSQ